MSALTPLCARNTFLPESRLEKLDSLKRVLLDLDMYVDFECLADEIESAIDTGSS